MDGKNCLDNSQYYVDCIIYNVCEVPRPYANFVKLDQLSRSNLQKMCCLLVGAMFFFQEKIIAK